MRRLAFWLIVVSLSGLGVLLYFKFTLPQQDSTVLLKDNSPAIQGYVTKKDNYVVVSSNGTEQLIPWDEIKSISGPNPLRAESSRFSFWVDKIDFLSSLGVVAALVVFSVGLYQYQQGLVWKKEEFLVGLIKSFGESASVRNAKQMLESLIQYGGDEILLYPEKAEDEASVYLSNNVIIDSLSVPLVRAGAHAPRIRSSFDTFLDYLERFEHYIRTGVVSKNSLYVHVGYWIDILGRHEKLDEAYRICVIRYAQHFGYDGVIHLLGRYNNRHRFWSWMRSLTGGGRSDPKTKTQSALAPAGPVQAPHVSGGGFPPPDVAESRRGKAHQAGLIPGVIAGAVVAFIAFRTLFKGKKRKHG